MDVKEKLSTLWIVVMINMIFADILTFALDIEESIVITQPLMLIAAIILQIPILMIYFSRTLNYKTNRISNITAAIITILFVTAGGSLTLHYIFIAAIEVICMLFIIKYAWKWKELE